MKYRCNDCDTVFDLENAKTRISTHEDEYGAISFGKRHNLVIYQCPECGCEELTRTHETDEKE